MQPCEFLECGRRHDDFSAVVDVLAFRAGHHHDGVAAEVLVKASSGAGGAPATTVGQARVVFVVEVAAELGWVC